MGVHDAYLGQTGSKGLETGVKDAGNECRNKSCEHKKRRGFGVGSAAGLTVYVWLRVASVSSCCEFTVDSLQHPCLPRADRLLLAYILVYPYAGANIRSQR